MGNKESAIRKWTQIFDTKQEAQIIRFALTGDGSDASTADVASKPGWAWVRYDEEPHKVSQVRNRIFPGVAQDVPVVIGKRYPTDRQVQILGINEPLYDMAMNEDQRFSYLVAPHGSTHHAILGTDPAEIDLANILNGKMRATDPESMSVYVESFNYYRYGELVQFGGGSWDFTGDVPGASGYQRYGLVALEVPTGSLTGILGPAGPVAMPATPPDVPIWHIPLGMVLLYNGMTAVVNGAFWDYRIAFSPVGPHKLEQNFYEFMHWNEMLWTQHLTGEI